MLAVVGGRRRSAQSRPPHCTTRRSGGESCAARTCACDAKFITALATSYRDTIAVARTRLDRGEPAMSLLKGIGISTPCVRLQTGSNWRRGGANSVPTAVAAAPQICHMHDARESPPQACKPMARLYIPHSKTLCMQHMLSASCEAQKSKAITLCLQPNACLVERDKLFSLHCRELAMTSCVKPTSTRMLYSRA